MAEETIQSEQAVPEQTVPEEAVPEESGPVRVVAAASAGPERPQKESPLLPILTVLLILVGIVDVILWGVAGYYLLRNAGTPAQGASASGVSAVYEEAPAAGGGEEPAALSAYL